MFVSKSKLRELIIPAIVFFFIAAYVNDTFKLQTKSILFPYLIFVFIVLIGVYIIIKSFASSPKVAASKSIDLSNVSKEKIETFYPWIMLYIAS
jgi:fucose 4-O-acetylase-like acetyltransferase